MTTKRDAHELLPVLGPTLDFMAVLWELDQALDTLSSRMQATLGVTAQQRILLRIVGRYPGLSAGRLARLLRIHPGTLSTALARLEKRQLLTRTRDPRDKRRVALGLTAKGRALDVPVEGTVEQAVARMLETQPKERTEATKRVLQALVAELGACARGGRGGAG